MKEQDYKTTARSRLTDRHRSDETFLAILDTLVEIKSQRQEQYLSIADTFLDIDKSEGKNLDLIGKLIGEERTLVNFIDRSYFGFLGARLSESYDIGYWYSLYKNKYGTLRTLTDEEYRRVLKARVVKNSSDNNRNSFLEVLNILLDNNSAVIVESENNTAIEVRIKDEDGLASYYLSKYKSDTNLIPIPLGRRLGVVHIMPVYYTSKLYPVVNVEGFSTDFNIDEIKSRVLEPIPFTENIGTAFSVDNVSFRTPLNEGYLDESISTTFSIDNIQITEKTTTYLSLQAPVENISTTFNIDNVQITKTVNYLNTTMDVESIGTTFSIDNVQITN